MDQQPTAAYSHITCETDDSIMVITLNRPDKLNAYTGAMGSEIEAAFRAADIDDSVRAIIVTGSGRAFCAGADVSGGAASFDTSGKHGAGVFGNRLASGSPRSGSGFVDAIFRCRKPSIAAINGPAVGIGITMTLPMDMRIAAKGAKIGFIFARRGLVPEAGSAWFLPKLVGLPQALRWAISGRIFAADEALSGGLVSELRARGSARPCQRDRAGVDLGDLSRLGRTHPADAVALRRRTRSVRPAGDRRRHFERARRSCRRPRGCRVIPRKTTAGISRQGHQRHAQSISVVDGRLI